jgi:hypothetical protein
MASSMNNFQVSPHFNLQEFSSHTGEIFIDAHLIDQLELFRDHLAEVFAEEVAIIITNGYRSVKDNEDLGKRLGFTDEGGLVSRNSQHMLGKAADIMCVKKKSWKFISPVLIGEEAKRFFSYTQVYEAHIHVDVR